MPLYIAQSGDLDRCHVCLTDGQTLKDRATQLLIKYKSGALVTQLKKRPDPTASSSPLPRDQTSLVRGTSHVDPSAVVVQSTF